MTFYIALYSEAGANLAPRDNVMETPLRLHPRNQCHFLLVAAWRGREETKCHYRYSTTDTVVAGLLTSHPVWREGGGSYEQLLEF